MKKNCQFVYLDLPTNRNLLNPQATLWSSAAGGEITCVDELSFLHGQNTDAEQLYSLLQS
jgi:hypothetical protein